MRDKPRKKINFCCFKCKHKANVEDLEEAKDVMGDRVVITGNVPPVDVVYAGSKEDIEKSVKECIRKAHNSPKGFVLSTGCQIPMNTPIEKVEMFMEAGRKYGKYPLYTSKRTKRIRSCYILCKKLYRK